MLKFVAIALSLAICITAHAGVRLAHHRLSMQGLGPIKIGMSQAEFNRLGFLLNHKFPHSDDQDSPGCYQASLTENPDIGLMFEDGILTRIEIISGEIRSLSGVGIGSTEKQASATYGERLVIEPHFYAPAPHHYLKIFSSNGRRAMVFETDGNHVDEFRAGLAESAQYVEGCL